MDNIIDGGDLIHPSKNNPIIVAHKFNCKHILTGLNF